MATVNTLEAVVAEHLAHDRLRVVLEPYAPSVPGCSCTSRSRAQVSPALRAFVAVAPEVAETPRKTPR